MSDLTNTTHALEIAENSENCMDDSIEYQESLRRDIAERFPIVSEKLELSDKRVVDHLGWNEGTDIFMFELV